MELNIEDMQDSQSIRTRMLVSLYQRRKEEPNKPYVSCRDLEKAAGCDIAFELWYLVDRGQIKKDGVYCYITADGVDAIECQNLR